MRRNAVIATDGPLGSTISRDGCYLFFAIVTLSFLTYALVRITTCELNRSIVSFTWILFVFLVLAVLHEAKCKTIIDQVNLKSKKNISYDMQMS